MNRTIIIAEAGVNHNGNLELAKQLIDVAAEAGADYVKFQTFKADKLVSKIAKKADYQLVNSQDENTSQWQMLQKLELNRETHLELITYCERKDIQFLSTAFDTESVELLKELNVQLHKIPSGEITNKPYLQRIGSLRKPIILSTGMASLGEIEDAVEVLHHAGTQTEDITILHCNTEYPTPMRDVNLKAMVTIREAFKVKVGYSDHTLGIEVPIAAVALGATVIEKHFTLDRNMEGPDHRASLEPAELKAMVEAIRNIEQALGNGIKKPSPSELKNKEIARKSIHLSKKLREGHIIREEDLIMKRPGNGISPMMIDQVLGKTVRNTLETEHQLLWSDLV